MQRLHITFFVCLVTILFMPPHLATASTFSDPEIPGGQTLYYGFTTGPYRSEYLRNVKQGEEVVESVQRITVAANRGGEKEYRVEEQGARRGGYRFQHVSRIVVRDGILAPVGIETWDRSPEGRLMRRFEAVFDDPTVDYPPDTYPVHCILQVLRGMTFREKETVSFYVWVTPTEIFRMHFDLIRQETIEVPAGTFACFYGEMRPDIRTILPVGNLLAKLLNPFIPRYHFWFASEPSHPLVKFEGVLGGTGAATHTIELTRIENPGPGEPGQPMLEEVKGPGPPTLTDNPV